MKVTLFTIFLALAGLAISAFDGSDASTVDISAIDVAALNPRAFMPTQSVDTTTTLTNSRITTIIEISTTTIQVGLNPTYTETTDFSTETTGYFGVTDLTPSASATSSECVATVYITVTSPSSSDSVIPLPTVLSDSLLISSKSQITTEITFQPIVTSTTTTTLPYFGNSTSENSGQFATGVPFNKTTTGSPVPTFTGSAVNVFNHNHKMLVVVAAGIVLLSF